MDVIKEKIRVMTEKLNELTILNSSEITMSYIECYEYKKNNTPPPPELNWNPVTDKTYFSGIDTHCWLHLSFKTPAAQCDFSQMRLRVKTGREGMWDATNPQFTVFVNGSTYQALDTNHTWLMLEHDTEYDIYMYLYIGMEEAKFHVDAFLETVDLKTESLYFDLNVPYLCLDELAYDSYDYITIRDSLSKACMLLDFRDFYSESYYKSIDKTAEYLKNEFYGKICGKSNMTVCCIGHTHIDVAWLWTVAQTKEKAQRSFSTVISLIDRYKDYVFMSSQPQLYQYVKDSDPELYEKIKQKVRQGSWEVEGAMWLEADTNLSGGESLVRQVLHGKKFMKKEFDVDSKILWLPDVFGYNGALPQILKKSGVTQFFTAKMWWNDVNKMPDDTFIWEGIDGSKVFTSMINGYVNPLDPSNVIRTWNSYKNKEYSSTQLLTFGYGDGGGGTTPEMMEIHRRMKFGIPGMPKTVVQRAGEFFDNIEKEFNKNAEELKFKPKWTGEMYFERHRGTYTSLAKNKKNNRKSEYSQLTAETLAIANNALLGNKYPETELQENLMTILLNQFHDILPGSCIKEVYDVCDNEYAKVLKSNKSISDSAIDDIASSVKTDGGVLVYNPTSFEQSEYIQIDGVCYFAKNIPPHGWKIINDVKETNGIIVGEKFIENNFIKVLFNDKYHIISVFDKLEKREVIPVGSEANVFEVYEDYPHNFDAWEINSYYKHKMWLADNVDGIEMLDDGIRVKRKYMKSYIVQDIKLKTDSKRIDFVTKVDWNEDHVLLKTSFPVDIRSTYATYDIGYGNLQRPNLPNNPWDREKFEVCAHKWADLSEYDYGVSLLNDCKYGYSVEDNIIKLSLLKAATYPNPVADREKHEFTYSLYPHSGDFREGNTVKEAYLLNMPLIAKKVNATNGVLSENFSIIKADCNNVIIETVKKAEDDNSVIVRAYECYNKKGNVQFETGFEFKEVYLCDMLENNLEKLNSKGNSVEAFVSNYEIITLKFIR